jgi:hypothetical protein
MVRSSYGNHNKESGWQRTQKPWRLVEAEMKSEIWWQIEREIERGREREREEERGRGRGKGRGRERVCVCMERSTQGSLKIQGLADEPKGL